LDGGEGDNGHRQWQWLVASGIEEGESMNVRECACVRIRVMDGLTLKEFNRIFFKCSRIVREG